MEKIKLSKRAKDISNQKFGKLTALYPIAKIKKQGTQWLCQCECGNTTKAVVSDLFCGHNVSCGCMSRKKNTTGNSHELMHRNIRLYNIWLLMRYRCSSPKAINYKYYGGKGIRVCQEWVDNYEAFYNWSISNGYSNMLTIDRKESNKNYSPNNCQWITKSENSKKKFKTKEGFRKPS